MPWFSSFHPGRLVTTGLHTSSLAEDFANILLPLLPVESVIIHLVIRAKELVEPVEDALDERHPEEEAHGAAHGRGDAGKVEEEVLAGLDLVRAGEADVEAPAAQSRVV